MKTPFSTASFTVFFFLALAGGARSAPPTETSLPPPFETLTPTEVPFTPNGERFGGVIYSQPGQLRPFTRKPSPNCGHEFTCFEISLAPDADPWCVAFYDGASEDPSFLIMPVKNCGAFDSVPTIEVLATKLVIPGNGFFYSEGASNHYSNVRRKFEWRKDGTIREIKQPFYYVGGLRRVQRPEWLPPEQPLPPIVLRSSPRGDAPIVATIPEGAEAEPLLSDVPQTGWFLVRTPFGLVGWYRCTAEPLSHDPLGLFFDGD